jgi:hypothetical protein
MSSAVPALRRRVEARLFDRDVAFLSLLFPAATYNPGDGRSVTTVGTRTGRILTESPCSRHGPDSHPNSLGAAASSVHPSAQGGWRAQRPWTSSSGAS